MQGCSSLLNMQDSGARMPHVPHAALCFEAKTVYGHPSNLLLTLPKHGLLLDCSVPLGWSHFMQAFCCPPYGTAKCAKAEHHASRPMGTFCC